MFRCFLITVILFVMPTIVDAIDQSGPYELMKEAAEKTFTRLKNEQKKIKKDPNYLCDIVKQELLSYVHIKYAGALILGRYYRESTPAQREIYFKIFEDYLAKAYGQILALYHGQTYHINPERLLTNTNVALVRIFIIASNEHAPLRLDFQWRKNSITGRWQMYDIIVEGISMINTKQNEWNNILRTQGIDGLIQLLKKYISQPILLEQKNNV